MSPRQICRGLTPWHPDAVAAIEIDGTELVVTLERNEKWWGLLSDLRVPITSIAAVDVVADGRRAARGVRAPGLGGSQRLIGTWRAKGDKQFVCVRRGQPAVKVTLDGQTYRTVLIGLDDAERVAADIRSVTGVRVTGVTANLPVADLDAARSFYADYLGLTEQDLGLGWVVRYTSRDGRAGVQVVTRDATSPEDSVLSVHVGDHVDEAYAEAVRRGYEIVHPLTTEPWGVRRFFVRDPAGNVINIVSHRDR